MRLDVLMEGQLAGSLDLSDASRPVFTYDASYLDEPHATPLSIRYPLGDRPIGDVSLRNWLTGVHTSANAQTRVWRVDGVLVMGGGR